MPPNLFLSFTLVVSFSFPLALFGQTGVATIGGRVTDQQSQPLPGITVLLDDTRGVATKTDGRFIIPDVAPGKHTLSVSGVGYATQNVSLYHSLPGRPSNSPFAWRKALPRWTKSSLPARARRPNCDSRPRP